MIKGFFFCFTSLIFGELGTVLYNSGQPFLGGSYMTACVLDTFFHLTGGVYSITQHMIAPLVVSSLGYMSYQIYKDDAKNGLKSFGITVSGLSMAFIDGAPGIAQNYDIFSQPSVNDPNYNLSHTAAHCAVIAVAVMYIKQLRMKYEANELEVEKFEDESLEFTKKHD